MTQRQGPRFQGTTSYSDPDGAFTLIYSSDWRQYSLPEGMDGVLVSPEVENPLTWVSVWKAELPETVRAQDLEVLIDGLEQGLAQFADCAVESSGEEVISDMIKLERVFTFQQDGATRKRKLWVLYSAQHQISITYQGANEEAYERWLAMANYSFHTLRLPDEIWYAPERDLIGWRKDRPDLRAEDDLQNGSFRPGWLEPACAYRLPIVVSATGTERFDRPIEIELDPIRLILSQEKSLRPVRLAEVGADGNTLDPDVLFQFDPKPNQPTGGRLIFLMKGQTAANQVRRYHLYLGQQEAALSATTGVPLVTVEDGVMHEEQESFVIRTPQAVYYYHKQGAGFASLEDSDGVDWIGYHPGGESAGEYRGIPNAVNPEGYFHPGGEACTSVLVSQGPLKATIYSESKGGAWACTWEIYPHYANLTMLKAANEYWFLYEGTPGGTLDTQNGYMVRSPGVRTPLSESWNEVLPEPKWVYFGVRPHNRVLYLIQKESDQTMDSYWPMRGEMTVFGFGRLKLEKYLRRTPAHFSIGLAESESPQDFAKIIHNVFDDIQIVMEKIETRS